MPMFNPFWSKVDICLYPFPKFMVALLMQQNITGS